MDDFHPALASPRTAHPPTARRLPGRGALSPASLAPANALEMGRAFLLGMRDGLLGLVHVFRLDADAERRRAATARQSAAIGKGGQDRARRREFAPTTTTGSPETLAKRRALQRRERPALARGSQELTRADDGEKEPRIKERIFLCCALNGAVFYLTKQFFVMLVVPLARAVYDSALASAAGPATPTLSDDDGLWRERIEPSLNFFKSAGLTLPLFIICRVVNAVLYQEIADSAFRQSRRSVRMMASISVMISDVLISILVELFFLVQAILCAFIPIPLLGRILGLFHMSLLYSLYSFEYKWYNQGIGLHQRLRYIEDNWPYFLGFGLPLTLLTDACADFLTAGLVFSLLFPLYIVAGNQSNVVMNARDVSLLVFYPTIRVSNIVFNAFGKIVMANKQRKSSSEEASIRQVQLTTEKPVRGTSEFADSL